MTASPSIYEVVRAGLGADGRLPAQGFALPDDPAPAPDQLLWAPGAIDGVLAGPGKKAAKKQARAASHALVKATRQPTERRLATLYETLRDESSLGYVDKMIEYVVTADPDAGTVHDLGVWLATTATDRSPVKIGLALVGITGLRDAGEVVMTLGAHDEFTLFAAVALSNGTPTPELDLWHLAQRVDGWGRIQCVEQLRGASDPQIKDWLLREGFRNSIMYEYLAFIAATTGDLLGALRRPDVDRELLTSAGQIITALIDGGPAEDIGDLTDAPALLDAYLDLLADRAETLTDLDTAVSIVGVLDRDPHGWAESKRAGLLDKAQRVIAAPLWPTLVTAGLESDDPHTFWLANQAAPRFAIDTFDIHLARLRADPFGTSWYAAWQAADSADRRGALVSLARNTCPREAITTGAPDTLLGFGPEFRVHDVLGWTLQELRHYPGTGTDLVALGLCSPVARNRNMSLNVLKEWPVEDWSDVVGEHLRELASSDRHEDIRAAAGELLARLDPRQ